MNKLTKLLSVFVIAGALGASVAGVAACKNNDDGPTHTHNYVCVDDGDGNCHEHCDVDGCPEPDKAAHPHEWGTDDKCSHTGCNAVKPHVCTPAADWSFDAKNHYKKCTHAGCNEHLQEGAHVGLSEDGTGVCTTCGAEIKHAVYEMFPTNILKNEAEFKTTTYAEGLNVGIFKILPGTTVRTRDRLNYNVYDWKNGEGTCADTPVATGFNARASVQYNGSARGFSVNAVAPGKLTFYCDNGSGGKTKQDLQSILLTKPNGDTQVIKYYCGDIYAITINCDQVGEYKITRGNEPGVGTTDVYYAKFEANVAVTPIKDIEIVNKGKTDYVLNDAFDKSKIQLQVVHEDGMVEPVDFSDPKLEIDASAFDGTKAGTYTIKIKYTVDENKVLKKEFTVQVHDVKAIELGFNAIIQGGNTSFGNGQYINHTVKQLYFKGDELDLDGLTVKIVLGEGESEIKNIVKTGFTVSGYDKTVAGKQTVTVTWDANTKIRNTFDVYVIDGVVSDIVVSESIAINVDGTIADAEVGTKAGEAYQFKTIQQALDFLEALKLDENVKKVINLAEGTYKEKLEINIPNLTIKGGQDASKTIIEWDSLYGIADEGGFAHTTDSTQTMSVREKAVGFVLEGVTVSNWYNSTEHFDQVFGPNYGEHRALAILIQADKVVIDNCRLLGYQDTIELFTGRQLIQNTYICGRTDFIFGTNNTTYFKDCEIESIVSGGYVTAFKGNNKDDNDWVQYGAIFDGCNFTAPESVVTAADTSLGRTWGKYASVAYVNCTMAGHITKVPYGTAGSKFSRYTAMSGAEPTNATVKFVEYNNTGAGAVTEEIAGMKLLTPEQAANYTNKDVFFGKTNGKVNYSTVWDGSRGVTITEKEYRFNKDTTGAIGRTTTDENGDSLFNGDMTVIATGECQYWTELTGTTGSKDFLWIKDGGVIKMNVAGSVTVSTYGKPYGAAENISINYVNGYAIITIKALNQEGYELSNGCCITLIKVDTSVTPAHEHQYGAWTVEEADKPTSTTEGTARRTCTECELDTPAQDTKVLLVLSTDNYNIAAGSAIGKSVYTLKTDETISFEADSLAGLHVHNYGPWVYDADNSKITKTCDQDGCDETTVEVAVPALTDERYTITNNNATLEAAGTGTYTIVLDEVEYSFTAPTPQIVLETISTSKELSAEVDGVTSNSLYLKGITVHNSKYWLFGTGSQIKFNVNAGATIIFYCDYWGGGIEVSGCGGTLSEVDGSHKSYTATEAGMITIDLTAGAQQSGYLRTISVTYEPKEITEKLEYVYAGDPSSTEEIVFAGAQDHNNGAYLRVTGSVQLKVKAGSTITIVTEYDKGAKVQEGDGEAVNMTVATEGNRNTSTYTVVADGIVTITPIQNELYILTITVELPTE